MGGLRLDSEDHHWAVGQVLTAPNDLPATKLGDPGLTVDISQVELAQKVEDEDEVDDELNRLGDDDS